MKWGVWNPSLSHPLQWKTIFMSLCLSVCVCRHVWVYERGSICMWVWRAHVHTFEQLIIFCSDSLLVMAITGSLFMTTCCRIPPLHLYMFNLCACVRVCLCACVWWGGNHSLSSGCKMPETQERMGTTPMVGLFCLSSVYKSLHVFECMLEFL